MRKVSQKYTSHHLLHEFGGQIKTDATQSTAKAYAKYVTWVMNDGDRQYFPLQLWQNHWSPWERRPRKG
jgi:hypothetical protein